MKNKKSILVRAMVIVKKLYEGKDMIKFRAPILPPQGLAATKIPQFGVFGFDDNQNDEGMDT